MTVVVLKHGNKWAIQDGEGKVLFVGKTRVSCFRYAYSKDWTISGYQHGGK